MAAAVAASTVSRNSERADSSTTSISSSWNSPAYGIGWTMSANGSARARSGATARWPASASPA